MDTRQIALLRPDQILSEIHRCPLAYLPVGPLEWHGPHLPLGMDALNAEKVAQLAAERTGGLVFPTFYWGTERERSPEMLRWLGFEGDEWIVGMDFPANSLPSMYATEEIFAVLIREQLRLAAQMGFKAIAVITGHAAENQIAVLQRLAAEFTARGPARVEVFLPFVTNSEGIMEVGHASRIETAVMMALHPQSVDLSGLPPSSELLRNIDWAIVDYPTFLGHPTPDHTVSADDDPRQASAEMGWKTVHQTVDQIVFQIQSLLAS
jgi:creatinine amidohydrolase